MYDYIQRMSKETSSGSMIMDTIKQYKGKDFLAENVFSNIKLTKKRSKVRLQRDILGQLNQSSYESNAYVDVFKISFGTCLLCSN